MANDQHFGAKDDPESKRAFFIKQNRLYVSSPYYTDSDGKLIPELPDWGPCHNWDQRPCNLGIDHYRDRKTSVAAGLNSGQSNRIRNSRKANIECRMSK